MDKKILSLESVRIDYSKKANFDLEKPPQDPFFLFKDWYNLASNENIKDVNAMSLSTIDKDNFPQTRQVLLKKMNELGFIFFTNYGSNKSQEILCNDKVSLNFFWRDLERQIRIVGYASKIPVEESKEYFLSRPKDSQIAAIISHQSKKLSSKSELIEKYNEYKSKYEDTDIDFPSYWGGFIVKPLKFEFWQGAESRLHDRLLYTKNNKGWNVSLLWP